MSIFVGSNGSCNLQYWITGGLGKFNLKTKTTFWIFAPILWFFCKHKLINHNTAKILEKLLWNLSKNSDCAVPVLYFSSFKIHAFWETGINGCGCCWGRVGGNLEVRGRNLCNLPGGCVLFNFLQNIHQTLDNFFFVYTWRRWGEQLEYWIVLFLILRRMSLTS